MPSLGWLEPTAIVLSERMEPPSVTVSEMDEDKKKDKTPLWRLAEAGDLERVKMALTAGAEVLHAQSTC